MLCSSVSQSVTLHTGEGEDKHFSHTGGRGDKHFSHTGGGQTFFTHSGGKDDGDEEMDVS